MIQVANKESLLCSSHCLSLYQPYLLCFSSQKKFCKKGVIVAIALLNNMKVTWTCCIKTFFLDTRTHASFSLTLMLIGMLYEMKVKSNLVHQINKHHLVRQKNFSYTQEIMSYFLQHNRLILILV